MFNTVRVMAICAMAFASLSATSALADEPILIKFSHVVADATPKGQGALLFKQLVEERLAGKVKVEVYPNSSLFGDANELEALRNNDVQLLAPSLAKFEQYTKQLQVFDLPFLFDDEAAVARFQKRETSRELLRSMAGRGIYGLAYWNNGLKQLSANQPLRDPADAAGLAFRIQPSPVLEAQFAAVDAKAVRLPFSDVSKAMQSGTVQGTEGPWSNIRGQNVGIKQNYVTETNHGVLNYMLVTNSEFWTSIPFAVRSELDNIVLEVTQTVNAEAASMNQREREQILANGGTTLVTLTPEQRQAWRAKMQPVWKTFEAQIGSDVLRAALTVNRR